MCKVDHCGNTKIQGKGYCALHYRRVWRMNNPVRDTWQHLKDNARRRGISVEMDLAEFELFCVTTDYLKLKGIGEMDYTIDRIDASKGYSLDNIQLLRNIDNVKKHRSYITGRPVEDLSPCPF